mmetsp:Transcript_150666/g.419974  ORF Transcript_150666/g.419974 Transcript_150666/m.419974 type:complete len:315 (+) Transcript_150666:321-1265(+)
MAQLIAPQAAAVKALAVLALEDGHHPLLRGALREELREGLEFRRAEGSSLWEWPDDYLLQGTTLGNSLRLLRLALRRGTGHKELLQGPSASGRRRRPSFPVRRLCAALQPRDQVAESGGGAAGVLGAVLREEGFPRVLLANYAGRKAAPYREALHDPVDAEVEILVPAPAVHLPILPQPMVHAAVRPFVLSRAIEEPIEETAVVRPIAARVGALLVEAVLEGSFEDLWSGSERAFAVEANILGLLQVPPIVLRAVWKDKLAMQVLRRWRRLLHRLLLLCRLRAWCSLLAHVGQPRRRWPSPPSECWGMTGAKMA